jgi:predicted DNA-binding transcriptional regulator AlpA
MPLDQSSSNRSKRKPESLIAATKLLTAVEVAALTGLSMETLAQWRSQRRGLPYVKISRNCIRYRQVDLDHWVEERMVHLELEPNVRRT